MKQFVMVYLGGEQPTDPMEANKHMDSYMQWLASLGEQVVVPMIPLKDTTTVRSTGEVKEGGSSYMSGFTILKANTLQDAILVAQTCPFLEIGGTLEVSEMMQMPVQ
ncbi:MAG: hypothetical protein HUJ29_12655 [Gammaproteobacteria bacterium]|nr:hypothetical protein [Gammaproteobacteria bacterium]